MIVYRILCQLCRIVFLHGHPGLARANDDALCPACGKPAAYSETHWRLANTCGDDIH